ncbi:MAG: flagellar biosynthetic protein FliO [Vicinamibacterales bacterium]
MTGLGFQSFAAVLIVLSLVAVLAWLARRGALGALGRKGKYIEVETAVPLGERRSLVVVSVEGRRLLLGLTPTHIAMVTELGRLPASGPSSVAASTFEQQLDAQSTSTKSL